MPTDVTVAIIGALAILIPVGLKTMMTMSRSWKAQEELLQLTKQKTIRDRKVDEQKRKRHYAEEKRQRAFDQYDESSKELILSMARSMISGNDVKKLQSSMDSMERHKKEFRVAREEYRRVTSEIADHVVGR